MNNKEAMEFVHWYKDRYNHDDNVIYKTSEELLWISESDDIEARKDFLMKLLWKKYNKKIHKKWWTMLYWDMCFNTLYTNYWPKWISLI